MSDPKEQQRKQAETEEAKDLELGEEASANVVGGAERVELSPIVITKPVDKSSP